MQNLIKLEVPESCTSCGGRVCFFCEGNCLPRTVWGRGVHSLRLTFWMEKRIWPWQWAMTPLGSQETRKAQRTSGWCPWMASLQCSLVHACPGCGCSSPGEILLTTLLRTARCKECCSRPGENGALWHGSCKYNTLTPAWLGWWWKQSLQKEKVGQHSRAWWGYRGVGEDRTGTTKCSKSQNILGEIMPHSPQEIQLEIHLLRKCGMENGMCSLVTKSYLTLLQPYEL